MPKTKKRGRIIIDREICKGCLLCVSVCPMELIKVSNDTNDKGYYPAEFMELNSEDPKCTGCCACATICPDIAIEVYRD